MTLSDFLKGNETKVAIMQHSLHNLWGTDTFYLKFRLETVKPDIVAESIAKFLGDQKEKIDLIWDGERSQQKCKLF